MQGMPHEECPRYSLETQTLHRLWWTGRILLGYHPLQHEGRDLVTALKAVTGTQHHHPKFWSHDTKLGCESVVHGQCEFGQKMVKLQF